jgi:hypothetical protein
MTKTRKRRTPREIPPKIDFSRGTRGKFHRRDMILNLPVYLDPDVQAYLNGIASKKRVPLSDLANELLKKEIELIETLKTR